MHTGLAEPCLRDLLQANDDVATLSSDLKSESFSIQTRRELSRAFHPRVVIWLFGAMDTNCL